MFFSFQIKKKKKSSQSCRSRMGCRSQHEGGNGEPPSWFGWAFPPSAYPSWSVTGVPAGHVRSRELNMTPTYCSPALRLQALPIMVLDVTRLANVTRAQLARVQDYRLDGRTDSSACRSADGFTDAMHKCRSTCNCGGRSVAISDAAGDMDIALNQLWAPTNSPQHC